VSEKREERIVPKHEDLSMIEAYKRCKEFFGFFLKNLEPFDDR